MKSKDVNNLTRMDDKLGTNFNPLVTVSIACYNSATYLSRALDSILYQTYSPIECIIIDDGSTDALDSVLDAYQNRSIKILRQPKNLGLRAARQLAIQEATGKYIFWQDADDWSHPNRIEKQVDFLEANPDIVACGTGSFIIKEGEARETIHLPVSKSKEIKAMLFFGFPFRSPTLGIRAMVAKLPACKVPDHVVQAEDYVLLSLLWEKGEMANLPEPLYYYREHSSENRITREENNADILAGRFVAWRNILSAFSLEASDHILKLHDKLTYYAARISKEDICSSREYLELLSHILAKNAKLKLLDQEILKRSVSNFSYRLLLHPLLPHKRALRYFSNYCILFIAEHLFKWPIKRLLVRKS